MIRLEHAGAATTVVMSRAPVNAIDPSFVAAFEGILDKIEKTKPTIVIIRSDQKCFCAGADLALIRGFFTAPGGTEAMVAYVKTLHSLFGRLEALEAVTLAVIDGPALGGGLELALSCDLRIASTRAKLGLPEARVGMIPGAGGTQRLPRLCGPGVAARLILGGEIVDGTEAARLGIVQWAVEPDGLGTHVAEIITRVTGLSRPALIASKDCIAAWFDPESDGYARELEKPWQLMKTEEARSRIDAFFTPKSN
jgi:enoyl-CoA hydratase